jgi:hypothetical protein
MPSGVLSKGAPDVRFIPAFAKNIPAPHAE